MTQSRMADQLYLREEQYKDATNLDARIQLHERFSINPYDWHRWVFDQFNLPSECRLLELGCGSGDLWLKNLSRMLAGWSVVLSDFSPGMLQVAKQKLTPSERPFVFSVIDAQALPYADASLDMIVANHMLYHVPDRQCALAEIKRVLKPGGRLYAATNGRQHLWQLTEFRRMFSDPTSTAEDETNTSGAGRFNLENGVEQLVTWFSDVTMRHYEDALVVTEVEPLLVYIMSGIRYAVAPDKVSQLRTVLEQEITAHGAIHIDKDTGLFEAIR
jgi:SAM-dependent methyltransferase